MAEFREAFCLPVAVVGCRWSGGQAAVDCVRGLLRLCRHLSESPLFQNNGPRGRGPGLRFFYSMGIGGCFGPAFILKEIEVILRVNEILGAVVFFSSLGR